MSKYKQNFLAPEFERKETFDFFVFAIVAFMLGPLTFVQNVLSLFVLFCAQLVFRYSFTTFLSDEFDVLFKVVSIIK